MNEEKKNFIDRDSLIKRRYREAEVTTSLDRTVFTRVWLEAREIH